MTGRWGNLLSGAVANLESRLDTILAEDNQASAKSRVVDTEAKQDGIDAQKLQPEPGVSRNPSRSSRPNSRLQDRLAKAVNQRGESPKTANAPLRSESPPLQSPPATAPETSRASIDSRTSEVVPPPKTEDTTEQDPKPEDATRLSTESNPASPPPASVVSDQPTSVAMTMSIPSILTPPTVSPRQSIDSDPSRASVDVSAIEEADLHTTRSPEALEAELSALQKTYDETLRENREELHSHLERIDALQSKLSYLSQQLATSAKATSTDSEATPTDKKLAEKDARITALMEEGQKLSKTEMRHMATIKKMRIKAQETDKEVTTLKQRLSKAERSIAEQADRAKRAENAEKAAQEKLKIVGKIEKDIEHIRAEREEAGLTITELRRQLSDALTRVEDAEKRVQTGALEAEKRATASLKDDIENIRIEKKLAEDRGKRELQEAREEATRQREKAKTVELELRGEIANLENKLELLRSRSEEASSSATGDSQATLLRQIETLQTQYALASENWQGIESTLTSRVAALEKERDETAKRESDIRRKARDINSKARKLEDELEATSDKASTLEKDLSEQRTSVQKLQARLTQAEAAAEGSRLDLEREKKVLEADFQQRLEEEKSKWRSELQSQSSNLEGNYLRADSPSTLNRKHSPDPLNMSRRIVPRQYSDMPLSPMDRMLFEERRPSTGRSKSNNIRSPEIGPPHRQDSFPSSISNLNGHSNSNAPSIHAYGDDDAYENGSPPQRINDMISVSTVGAGPSVQLVERMSAIVRRLESEKATTKEEVARLIAQRDEAREEVVRLMSEVEEKRKLDQRVDKLEKELSEMNNRFENTLDLLGEKSEKVEELEHDVADWKKMYRELVEQKM